MLYNDYLAFEEQSPTRHEYLGGEIHEVPAATPEHSMLSARVLCLVADRLPPRCRAFTCNLRVRIPATGLSTYPDGAVVCGGTHRADDDLNAVTNPVLLVEITSNSTEEYDRGAKLRHYQTIPTLREVLIVSHREPRVTLYRREGERWNIVEAGAGETLALSSIGAQLVVDDLYRPTLPDAATSPGTS